MKTENKTLFTNQSKQKQAVFVTHGTHSETDRQKYDYYATDPKCLDDLLNRETFNKKIWEPACGEGHLSKRMIEKFDKDVYSSDIVNRGYGSVKDFLCIEIQDWIGDIITNPPYIYAQEFVEQSLRIIPEKNKVAMFLKLTFLEGQKRKSFFRTHPPKIVYVYSRRQLCGKNGDFNNSNPSAVAYCWYIWEKGYSGETILKWI